MKNPSILVMVQDFQPSVLRNIQTKTVVTARCAVRGSTCYIIFFPAGFEAFLLKTTPPVLGKEF